MTDTLNSQAASPAPLWRRLAAMAYDTLIALALLMTATAIALPLNQGEAFGSGNLGFQLYLIAVVAGFFLLFWRKGGQTLGMRAWKIKLVTESETAPSFGQLVLRAITAVPSIALLGLGVFWSAFDRDKLAVHDRLSNTRLILVSK
ncbi:MAG: RDD family protein [Gammaproteobacteria bacterium]